MAVLERKEEAQGISVRSFSFNKKRIEKSLESGVKQIPEGLSIEEKRLFLLGKK